MRIKIGKGFTYILERELLLHRHGQSKTLRHTLSFQRQ